MRGILMQKCEYDRLMATVPGIGVLAKPAINEIVYYFFEDFPGSAGMDRALDQMYAAKDRGTVLSVEFHDNHKMLEVI
jgi:hypothetical protein